MKIPALEPAIIVIFGITGDLAKRKLLPALYHLVKDGLLHESTEIVGITRSGMSKEELFATIELCVNEADGVCDPTAIRMLQSKLHLRNMNVTDAQQYKELRAGLDDIEQKHGVCMNRLYYLSIPPNVSGPIITLLGENGLNESCQHNRAETRLLVEKPFGYDYSSAVELMKTTSKQFDESQVFRIDHYLAKETVQNILAFRFNNPIFEPLWNNKHIASIELIAHEKIGIEGRAKFYEQTGALRDLIQSHLLQILALVAMEQPADDSSNALHKQKVALLRSVNAIAPNKVVTDAIRGQYRLYREEVENNESNIETFAALRLKIDSRRWRNVLVTVRTGKALHEKSSKISVIFKPTKDTPHHNILTFRLQPNEGIELSLRVKRPGFSNEIQAAEMDFSYKRTFDADGHPDAYERVLVDAVRGDHTLFATSQEVLESWRIVQSVITEWAKSDNGLFVYDRGSEGPQVPDNWKSS